MILVSKKKTKQTITLWEIGHKNIGLRYAESAVSYSQVRYLPVTKDVSRELYILISREESGLNHMNTTRAIHVTSTYMNYTCFWDLQY